MSKKHRHHRQHHHFDPHHERGVGVTYAVGGYGWGYGTAQSGIHDCLSGQQFPADSCPASDSGAVASSGTDAGAASAPA